MSAEWTVTARWLFPVDRPPLEGGTLTIQGDKIVAVEPHGQRRADTDYGDAAILPGLVDAHTHLDLSGLRDQCPPSQDFVGWLQRVTAYRRDSPGHKMLANVGAGVDDCIRFGTTLIGDIAGHPGWHSWLSFRTRLVRSVVFRELLGLTAERAQIAADDAHTWFAYFPPVGVSRPGLSPHAPYSVRSSLLAEAISLAQHPPEPADVHLAPSLKFESVPVAIHLAETREELELLRARSGPFVDFLKERNVWDPDGLVTGVAQVLEMCRNLSHCLFIHGNYLDPRLPRPAGATVVYCPRTHFRFGHSRHPLPELLAAGWPVALGTDSLASNPDLNLLTEARFVHEAFSDLPGANVLRMATLTGAEALGWGDVTGSLTPGKSADFVVLPLPTRNAQDPHELILESSLDVAAVCCQGRWLVPFVP